MQQISVGGSADHAGQEVRLGAGWPGRSPLLFSFHTSSISRPLLSLLFSIGAQQKNVFGEFQHLPGHGGGHGAFVGREAEEERGQSNILLETAYKHMSHAVRGLGSSVTLPASCLRAKLNMLGIRYICEKWSPLPPQTTALRRIITELLCGIKHICCGLSIKSVWLFALASEHPY